jgi:hypothetical protein
MQPISRVRPWNATLRWGDSETMAKRPKLAVKVSQCISEWAEIETVLAIYFSTLLGAEPKAALAIYSALDNRAAQLRAVAAAAAEKLHPDDADLFEAVLQAALRPTMKERDKLAHWCWGTCDELPDDLVIREPSDKTDSHFIALEYEGGTSPLRNTTDEPDKTYVVSEKYLTGLHKRLINAKGYLGLLRVRASSKSPQKERDEALQELSSEPLIHEAWDRLCEARKNALSKPRPSPPPRRRGKP